MSNNLFSRNTVGVGKKAMSNNAKTFICFVVGSIFLVVISFTAYFAVMQQGGSARLVLYENAIIWNFDEAVHHFDAALLASIQQRQTGNQEFKDSVENHCAVSLKALETSVQYIVVQSNKHKLQDVMKLTQQFEQVNTKEWAIERLHIEFQQSQMKIAEDVLLQIENVNKQITEPAAKFSLDTFNRLRRLTEQHSEAKSEEKRANIRMQIADLVEQLNKSINNIPAENTKEAAGKLKMTFDAYTEIIGRISDIVAQRSAVQAETDNIAEDIDVQTAQLRQALLERIKECGDNNDALQQQTVTLIIVSCVVSVILYFIIGLFITRSLQTSSPASFDLYSPTRPLESRDPKDLRPVAEKLQEIVNLLKQ